MTVQLVTIRRWMLEHSVVAAPAALIQGSAERFAVTIWNLARRVLADVVVHRASMTTLTPRGSPIRHCSALARDSEYLVDTRLRVGFCRSVLVTALLARSRARHNALPCRSSQRPVPAHG